MIASDLGDDGFRAYFVIQTPEMLSRYERFVAPAAADLAQGLPHASPAVIDHAGHALPHEQPELLRVLISEWLIRVGRLT